MPVSQQDSFRGQIPLSACTARESLVESLLLFRLSTHLEANGMTRKEAVRLNAQEDTLLSLGFTRAEAEALRRISVRLRRWYEMECGTDNGCIERDEETGKTFWHYATSGRRSPIRDLETGAVKRLKAIIAARNDREDVVLHPAAKIAFYLQTDPRGAALYLLRSDDVPEGKEAQSYYTRGICIY